VKNNENFHQYRLLSNRLPNNNHWRLDLVCGFQVNEMAELSNVARGRFFGVFEVAWLPRWTIRPPLLEDTAQFSKESSWFAYTMRCLVLFICLVIIAASTGQSTEDVKDIKPVVQLKRRSLADQLTLWLEDIFEMMLRRGEKMVEKLPVDKEEQRAIKGSIQSITTRVSSMSSRISNSIVHVWNTMMSRALTFLRLDRLPAPVKEAIRTWARSQRSDGDSSEFYNRIDLDPITN